MNDKIKLLTEKRNELFPPKLEKGCEVECYRENSGGNIDYSYDIELRVLGNEKHNEYFIDFIDDRYEITKILGKPISILDILRMVEEDSNFDEYCLETSG